MLSISSRVTADQDIPEIKPPRVIYDRVDWSKVKPSTGAANLHKVVGERLRGEQ